MTTTNELYAVKITFDIYGEYCITRHKKDSAGKIMYDLHCAYCVNNKKHHKKAHQHGSDEECPVLKEIYK